MIKNKNNLLFVFLAALIGLSIFMFMYSETLDPRYDDWIMTTGHDTTQSYVGWLMYRGSDWNWPLGIAQNYGYPIGSSISSSDSIPLLAIGFKIINKFLPVTFQYFGFWIMLCFIFQAIFGFLLSRYFLKDNSLAILAAVFFILSPVMLFRLGGHFALGGQWLILAALYLLINRINKAPQFWWAVLLVISLLVHPYLLFINFFLYMAYLAKNYFVEKNISLGKTLIFLFIQIAIIAIFAQMIGLFYLSSLGAPGFGDFSMNLNALFNPLGWSNILPNFNIIRYQSEGFNYLGLGIIILSFISLYYFIKNNKYKNIWKKYWPIAIILLILFLLALSNTVAIGSITLFTLPLPKIITDYLFAVFRSSGRLFWPIYYLIILGSFYTLKNIKYKKALFLIAIILLIQVYDLSDKIKSRSLEFEGQVWQNIYLEQQMPIISRGYEHISFLPVIPDRNFVDYAIFASKNKMTLNNGWFARDDNNLIKAVNKEDNNVKSGIIKSNTIYIFSRDHEKYIANLDMSNHLLTQIDNTFVLSPYYDKK